MKVAVCILFFGKVDQTKKCINGFLNENVNIYVFSNGNEIQVYDELVYWAKDYKNVFIIFSNKNLGVSGGRNQLVRVTNEPFLLFVDNDIYVEDRSWLEKFSKSFSRKFDLYIPRLFNVHEEKFQEYRKIAIEGRVVKYEVPGNSTTNLFPGGAVMVDRNLFEREGPYDENIFVGLEDLEYCIRCLLRGRPIRGLLLNDVTFFHQHILPKKKVDHQVFKTRYCFKSIENSFKYIQKKHNLKIKHNWEKWVLRKWKEFNMVYFYFYRIKKYFSEFF